MRYASAKASACSASVPCALAGSGKPQWAVIGWPGQMGQGSLGASSQTVNTKSSFGASGVVNSSQDFERSLETSKFDLRSTVEVWGLTAPLGWLAARLSLNSPVPRT